VNSRSSGWISRAGSGIFIQPADGWLFLSLQPGKGGNSQQPGSPVSQILDNSGFSAMLNPSISLSNTIETPSENVMNSTALFSKISLIDLEQKLTGFRHFVSAWLFRDEGLTFLVDPGPRFSIEVLIAELRRLGVKRLDYILLTHIHIDHAGGTGRLLEIYPEAEVICHPKAWEHLIDPQKLWQGSLKVLGPVAEAYGEIFPVPAARLHYQPEITAGPYRIEVIETPGHAVHHVSYLLHPLLFAGEVAGVNQSVADSHYARPATPPRFKLETSLASLDRVIDRKPELICYGHHGYRANALSVLRAAREQLRLWTATVGEQLAQGTDHLNARIIAHLQTKDTAFALLSELPEDIRQRENYFIGNTLAVMREYLETKTAA